MKTWERFVNHDLEKALEACSGRFNRVSIKYYIDESMKSELRDIGNYLVRIKDKKSQVRPLRICADVNVIDDINSKISGIENKEFILGDIPQYTDMGFIIDGNRYSIISKYDKISGWYFITKDNEFSVSMFTPANSGEAFTIALKSGRKGGLKVLRGGRQIDLPVFLKAVTKLSYGELRSYLGDNLSTMNEFLGDEDSTEKCVLAAVKELMGRTNHSSAADANKYLNSELFQKVRVDDAGRERLVNDMKLVNRCIGKELGADVVLKDGSRYKAGTLLTYDILNNIDNDSNINHIEVSVNDMNYGIYKHKVNPDGIDSEEILAVTRVFLNIIEGIEETRDRDNLGNKVIIDYSNLFCQEIKKKLNRLSISLDKKISEEGDLTQIFADVYGNIEDNFLMKVINTEKVVQTRKETSVLATLSKSHSIMNTASDKNKSEDMRMVRRDQIGRVCPIETPESSKAGMVSAIPYFSEIDHRGRILSPYCKVENGEVIPEKVFLSLEQEFNKNIALYDQDLTEEFVTCRVDTVYKKVPSREVDYIEYSALQIVGPGVAYVPFAGNNSVKRLMLASNMVKQGITTLYPERELVTTGISSFVSYGVFTFEDAVDMFMVAGDLSEHDRGYIMENKIMLDEVIGGENVENRYLRLYTKDSSGNTIGINVYVPTFYPTYDGTVTHYDINLTKNYWVKGEVIFSTIEQDFTERKVKVLSDAEHYMDAEQIGKRGVRLGNNLKVLFKVYEHSTFEDAICINERLVESRKMSSIKIQEIRVRINDAYIEDSTSGEEMIDMFSGALNDSTVDYLDVTGLPKKGTYIKSEQVLVGIVRVPKGSVGAQSGQPKPYRMPIGEHGYVINSRVEGSEAFVSIGTILDLQVGDKLTGRYGNKGVIARIVKNEDMPYSEKGDVPDIILNPLGVPSRMNIGQLLECALGAISMHNNVIYAVEPASTNSYDMVRNEMNEKDEFGNPNVELLTFYDGKTGIKFEQKALLGCMYILKLEHTVGKAYNFINMNPKLSPITRQPLEGSKREGGQRLSEYAMWGLLSHGVPELVDSITSLYSDDSQGRKMLEDSIKKNPVRRKASGINKAGDYTIALMRSIGIDSVKTSGGYQARFLTNKDIDEIAPNSVNLSNEGWEKVLHDVNVFNPKRIKGDDRKVYAKLMLGCEMVMPIVLTAEIASCFVAEWIMSGDRVIRPLTERKLKEIYNGDVFCYLNQGYTEIYNAQEVEELKTTDLDKVEKLITGAHCVVEMFKKYDGTEVIEFIKDVGMGLSYAERILATYKLSDLVVDRVLIIPSAFRPTIQGSVGDYKTSDVDLLYSGLLTAVADSKYKGDIKEKRQERIAKALKEFISSDRGKNHKSVIQLLGGKEGVIRKSNLGKRIVASGRAVITVDGRIGPEELGVPYTGCLKLWEQHIVSYILNHVDKLQIKGVSIASSGSGMGHRDLRKILHYIRSEDSVSLRKYLEDATKQKISLTELKEFKNKFRLKVDEFLTNETVLAIREPAWHKYNILAYTPVAVDDYSLHLHPLMCKPYNADFDGDQMAVFSLPTENDKRVAREKMLARSNIINIKDGNLIIDVNQDMIAGIYMMTMLYKNSKRLEDTDYYYKRGRLKTIYTYNSVVELEYDLNIGKVKLWDIVNVSIYNRMYVSTAGRIVLNNLIPDGRGFTEKPWSNPLGIRGIGEDESKTKYYDLARDGLVKKGATVCFDLNGNEIVKAGGVTSLTKEVAYKNLSELDKLKFINRLATYGFRYCDMLGLTLSLMDFEQYSVKDKIVGDANRMDDNIQEQYKMGLYSEKEKSDMISEIWREAKDSTYEEIMKLMSRDNNLFIIVDSGSRGDKSQFRNVFGLIGQPVDTDGSPLDYIVKGNYTTGISAHDIYASAYEGRKNVVMSSLKAAAPGVLTRELVYMMSSLKVTDKDCGNMQSIALPYKVLAGSSAEEIIGRTLDKSTEGYSKLENSLFDGSKITNRTIKTIETLGFESITLSDGTVVELKYKLLPSTRDLLVGKYAEINGVEQFLTKEDVDWIESQGVKELNVRSMFNCVSKRGVCQYCYGKDSITGELPEIGLNVGVMAAQAVAETTSQINMDSINKAVGDDSDSGIDYLTSFIKQSEKRDVAMYDGVVRVVETSKKEGHYIIEVVNPRFKEKCKATDIAANRMILSDGDYVKEGDFLTSDTKSYASLMGVLPLEDIRFRLMEDYYTVFNSGGKALVRPVHFEAIVKMHTQHVQVINGRDSKFGSGDITTFGEVWSYNLDKKDSDKIEFTFILVGSNTVRNTGNYLLNSAHSHVKGVLSKAASLGYVDNCSSDLANLYLGNKIQPGFPKISFKVDTGLVKMDEVRTEPIRVLTKPDGVASGEIFTYVPGLPTMVEEKKEVIVTEMPKKPVMNDEGDIFRRTATDIYNT